SESIKTCLIKLTQLVDKNDISIELKRNILDDIEKIKEGKDTNIFDKYFALLVDKYESLLDYVEDYTIFLSEENRCIEKAHNIFYENSETIKNLAQRNYLYIPYVNRYFSFDEIEPRINKSINIHMQTLALDKAQTKGKKYVFDLKEKYSYKNDLDILVKDIKSANDKTVLLVLPTKNRAEQIKNYLLENSIKSEFIESINNNFIKGHVYITNGIISGGYESCELNLLLIAEAVCGVNLNKLKKKKQDSIGQNINSYDDLEIGDYVVHENHGIGIYKGINTINVLEFQKDYIKIEYANLDSLYVPINQLDLVKKYVCDDDTKPKINALGTKEWQKIKRKVSEHVKEMAKELIQLYAKREELRGYAFPKDSPWQKEFEDAFDYELTADQKTSVEEVKADMEDIKPMDRLLCGDVGYGKTEVALRAAFKAAIAGKQVAYMVPTTVLSLQQYRTFNERMQDFGIRVEMLSRFKTKVEQNKIIKNMTDGTIDIVVGTHRLLSKDVFFKDLGLLIIDEEHRFGVKAKETIKQLKDSVDVLSMTATPIPRTLHMSMIGIRQMSTLTEPPMERLPVHTYVLEYDENVVQAAIEKELLRDGQVFYINNRVDNIADVTDKVQKLVPHAKVAFAHGQMEPDDIENIMIKVIEHEIDVLVCTTILESGIDIQNANTIIIENADKLGLAQLYQIRGRVGRSSRLAYAYITYPKNKVLSEVSEKRLKAIKDFTEFGSGFKIALRDLEIRGAGNLLGRQQHGHMAKVGYEMYLTLLQRAVKTEKDGKLQDFQEVVAKEIKIELDVSAYISDSYISDPVQKIFMYQRISQINTEDEMMDVIDELLDRYGALPKATENLIKIVEIRNKARKLGITKIVGTNNFIKFEPSLLKIQLTNNYNNDILLRVQLEIEKMLKNNEKG
ncbi:MAG: transcription-repair coupling factor, partial [Clostridia bacterium]